jgi:hypothetical protein
VPGGNLRALTISTGTIIMRTRFALLLAAAGLSLGACATDGVYAGGDVGLAYNDPFYDPAACWNYGWSDTSWGGPYCGWYDGFFYPGSGIYVYDRNHHAHVWSDGQKDHWSQQREQWHNDATVGARSALGMNDGTAISREVAPREMGMGMRGFGGQFGGFRGGSFGGFHGGVGGFHGGGRAR